MHRKLADILVEEKKKKSEKSDKVNKILDGQNLILFFTKGNGIFGAPEESRIVFSKMKTPDDDDMNWGQSKFSALDLIKVLAGNVQQSFFSHQDLPQIKVIDRDNAEDQLMKHADDETVDCTSRKLLGMTSNIPQIGKLIKV